MQKERAKFHPVWKHYCYLFYLLLVHFFTFILLLLFYLKLSHLFIIMFYLAIGESLRRVRKKSSKQLSICRKYLNSTMSWRRLQHNGATWLECRHHFSGSHGAWSRHQRLKSNVLVPHTSQESPNTNARHLSLTGFGADQPVPLYGGYRLPSVHFTVPHMTFPYSTSAPYRKLVLYGPACTGVRVRRLRRDTLVLHSAPY